MNIEWADPPAPRASELYTEFAAALKDNPGRWAKWPRTYTNPTSAGAIRKNIVDGDVRAPVPFRQGRWDAVVRQGILYVRYLGETEIHHRDGDPTNNNLDNLEIR